MEDAQMNPLVAAITVVCDNPRHARGKVAKVTTYYRNQDERRELPRWTRQGGIHARAWRRRGDRLTEVGIKPEVVDIFGPDLRREKCKLCGQAIRAYVDDVMFPVLDQLAARGESRISIRQLNLLASRQQHKG